MVRNVWMGFKCLGSLIISVSLWGGDSQEFLHSLPLVCASVSDVQFSFFVTRTPKERARGLMHQSSLAPLFGMLFIHEKPQRLAFWMKNTSIPLTLAFLDEKKKIVQIELLKPFDVQPVISKSLVRYAIEVNLGEFEAHHVRVGDIVYWEDLSFHNGKTCGPKDDAF